MNEHYTTLGVSETATADEIKKSYRKLANKYHPDKEGGDQDTFKNISVAYDTLGNAEKRATYDQMQRGSHSQFHFNTGAFQDIFGHGGHNPFEQMFRQQHVQKNRDLNINCQITFIESYTGKQFEASFQLPSGTTQSIAVNIPAGISHGLTIKYQQMGDNSNPNLLRGDLNVTVLVADDLNFTRTGDDVYREVTITPIESMIGCSKQVESITGETMLIEIRAGIQSGTEYARQGLGFPNLQSGRKGRFVSVVKIAPPIITDPNMIERLKQLNTEINNLA